MNIQTDYSTLSTSLTPSEMATVNVIYNMLENLPEAENSEESSGSCDADSPPILPPPKDKFKIVYLTFGLLGITSLLPWNFFITAHDFWMYKFRNTTSQTCADPSAQRSDLQASFTSYIALSMNIPYVISLLLLMFVSTRIARIQYVVGSLLFQIVVFVAITALVNVNTDGWQMPFFTLAMCVVVMLGTSSAIFQAATGGIFSVFPSKYIHIMVLSQALAGIFAAAAQIISLLGHCDPLLSAFIYFLCADAILIITLCLYLGINKTVFFQYYKSGSPENKPMQDVSSANVKLNIPLRIVMRQVWPFAVCLLLTFTVTIGIYPGLAVLVVSENNSSGSIWTGRLFLPVACFSVFNCGDFFGRLLSGWLKIDAYSGRYRLLVFSLVRIVFIPLFLFCNAHPREHIPVIFGDIVYISLVAILGFTNGCISTWALIAGTKCVNTEMQHTASIVLFAFLGLGLMIGSFSSYGLIQLL